MLRKELYKTVDWSAIPREDYLFAMERSPVRDLEIKGLLRDALSDRVEDVTLLARGIDASYAYEGYAAFRAEDLID
jgi:cell filamentation protein